MTAAVDDLAAADDRPGEPNILEEGGDDVPPPPSDGGVNLTVTTTYTLSP